MGQKETGTGWHLLHPSPSCCPGKHHNWKRFHCTNQCLLLKSNLFIPLHCSPSFDSQTEFKHCSWYLKLIFCKALSFQPDMNTGFLQQAPGWAQSVLTQEKAKHQSAKHLHLWKQHFLQGLRPQRTATEVVRIRGKQRDLRNHVYLIFKAP